MADEPVEVAPEPHESAPPAPNLRPWDITHGYIDNHGWCAQCGRSEGFKCHAEPEPAEEVSDEPAPPESYEPLEPQEPAEDLEP